MIFFDGAFGTYYMQKTGDRNYCELANINNRDAVLGIHREYAACGVDAIKTNTFRANLTVFDDQELLRQIITEGYGIASEAVRGTKTEVFADIGGISSEETAAVEYLRVADIFIELGVKNFLFETLSHFTGIETAASEIKRRVEDSQVIVSFAVSQDGYTANGIYYKTLINEAAHCVNIDAVGLNCVCGPAHLLNLARRLDSVKKPLSIMPNAGYPTTVNGRMFFQDNTDYFGEKIKELSSLGVEILGGCCGTTPVHIQKAIAAVKSENAGLDKEQSGAARLYTIGGEAHAKLEMKPLMVEVDPPVDGDDSFLLSSVDMLKKYGVETITLADSPLSRPKADSVLTAARLKTERQIDVLPHITCRDKNSIALKGSLLGAHLFGINKVLIVTGDPPIDTAGTKTAAVFNFNSMQLISYVNNLNKEIFNDRPFRIGGALNVNAKNFKVELERARQKVSNGAGFLLTQPIFSEEAVENFKLAKQELSCKLYAGILPVSSYKNAVFLNNEVAGIKIPPHILAAMKNANKNTLWDISAGLCTDMIHAVYDYADGFYIMTPLQKTELVCHLINRCFYV